LDGVAAAYGLNVLTVFRWLANFALGGQNSFLADSRRRSDFPPMSDALPSWDAP
jgi:hypothetical protein